jgi:hypothetical protein
MLTIKSRLLFNWIWPPIVQGELDHFTERWNSHIIRRRRNKLIPSGVSPNELYEHPEYFGGRCFAIPVPKDAIDALHSTIKLTRKAALQWVPEEFDTITWQVYELLGSPSCSAETAWVANGFSYVLAQTRIQAVKSRQRPPVPVPQILSALGRS